MVGRLSPLDDSTRLGIDAQTRNASVTESAELGPALRLQTIRVSSVFNPWLLLVSFVYFVVVHFFCWSLLL